MWRLHWEDCGLHDWIIQLLMCMGALIHAWMHTHMHTHSHMQRGFGVWVLWMSRWLTRAGIAGYFDQASLCYFSSLFICFPPFFSSFLLLSPSHSISNCFHSAAASNQTHKRVHTQYSFLVCTEYATQSFIFLFPSSVAHKCEHANMHPFLTFLKLDSIKFVFISSLQTGLSLYRRNNIPACCVKLYELMKSAGLLVKDLMWGNIAPLVLYTDLQQCFLKLALPHLKTVCILPQVNL